MCTLNDITISLNFYSLFFLFIRENIKLSVSRKMSSLSKRNYYFDRLKYFITAIFGNIDSLFFKLS